MRHAALALLALVLVACSSSSPRPTPPTPVQEPSDGAITLHWDPITEATDGTGLGDVTRYTLTITGPSGISERRTYNAAGTYTVPLAPGRYSFELTASSDALGESDPSGRVFAEAPSGPTAVSGNPGGSPD